jgi:hypothetical protein
MTFHSCVDASSAATHGRDLTINPVVIYREPLAGHWAENIGSTTIRLELIELKN